VELVLVFMAVFGTSVNGRCPAKLCIALVTCLPYRPWRGTGYKVMLAGIDPTLGGFASARLVLGLWQAGWWSRFAGVLN
jgi:hypothetical protein